MTKTIQAQRKEFARIRSLFAYELGAQAFEQALYSAPETPETPEQWIAAAKAVTCRCGRCAGTGRFITHVENGVPTGPGGQCFRCRGKGYQTFADVERNNNYDRYIMPARALA